MKNVRKEDSNPFQFQEIFHQDLIKNLLTPPKNEEDLRNISLTADLSKDYENFRAGWLMPYIAKIIDPGQFGGLKGHSTAHYLITLFDFILSKTENARIPRAGMDALIDFVKAFYQINHAKVIC